MTSINVEVSVLLFRGNEYHYMIRNKKKKATQYIKYLKRCCNEDDLRCFLKNKSRFQDPVFELKLMNIL